MPTSRCYVCAMRIPTACCGAAWLPFRPLMAYNGATLGMHLPINFIHHHP